MTQIQFLLLMFLATVSINSGLYAQQPNLEKLIRQLKHPDSEQRELAASSIGNLGPKGLLAVSALVQTLKDADADVSVAAAYSIGDIGPAAKDAVPALVAGLSDNRKASWGSVPGGAATVQGACWFALHEIGEPATKSVSKFLDSKIPKQRALAVWVVSAGGSASKPYLPKIAELLNDDNDEVQHRAVKALGVIKADPGFCVKKLIPLLSSDNANLQIRATVSLSQHEGNATAAIKILRKQLKHKDGTVRGVTAYCLGRMGAAAKNALPDLRQLSNDEETVFFRPFIEHKIGRSVKANSAVAIQRIEKLVAQQK